MVVLISQRSGSSSGTDEKGERRGGSRERWKMGMENSRGWTQGWLSGAGIWQAGTGHWLSWSLAGWNLAGCDRTGRGWIGRGGWTQGWQDWILVGLEPGSWKLEPGTWNLEPET